MDFNGIELGNYGEYSSSNYGAHTKRVKINNVTFFFSYDTVVAFRTNGKLFICENVWGNTTGKHLNWINRDKSIRMKYEEFTNVLNEVLMGMKYRNDLSKLIGEKLQ